MQYEVENKFPVATLDDIMQKLTDLGAEFREVIQQADVYFAHPMRNFAETDEALRIRQIGETNLVTYKGPRIDKATKTRREIELPLAPGSDHVADYTTLFEELGFRTVAVVRKHRRGGHLTWNQWSIELALDEVEGLGQFVELEIVVEEDRLPAAQQAVLELAAHLELPNPEPSSYLEMILGAD